MSRPVHSALLFLLSATAPSLQLDWRGAPECPSREAFLADVRRLRGEVLEAADGVAVEVTLAPAEPQWRARVATRVRGSAGLRELEAATCAEVVAAAAVVVSLALSEPEPAPPPEERPSPERPTSTFALGVTGGVRVGPLPSVAPGASLAGCSRSSGFDSSCW